MNRLLPLLALSILAAPRALAIPPESVAAAQEAFSNAMSASDFLEAARAFDALGQMTPNEGLHFNAANAYFRAGDLGRAILHYRRALRLSPLYDEARANLAAARRKRLDQAEPENPSILERLAFWHGRMSARSKFWGAFVCWFFFWVFLTLRRFGAFPHTVPLALCSLLLAICLGSSLAIERWRESRHPPAVILAPEVSLRIGGGDRYDLAVKEPLHAGAEVRVIETRPGWFRVLLNDEIGGWVPADSLGLVPPPPAGAPETISLKIQ